MRYNYYIFCLGLLLLASACNKKYCPGGCRDPISIYNNSNLDVYSYLVLTNSDTILSIIKPRFLYLIKSNEKHTDYLPGRYEDRIENKFLLFVLSKDSVGNHSWDYISTNNVFLKRYEMSASEIEQLNGHISYP